MIRVNCVDYRVEYLVLYGGESSSVGKAILREFTKRLSTIKSLSRTLEVPKEPFKALKSCEC